MHSNAVVTRTLTGRQRAFSLRKADSQFPLSQHALCVKTYTVAHAVDRLIQLQTRVQAPACMHGDSLVKLDTAGAVS